MPRPQTGRPTLTPAPTAGPTPPPDPPPDPPPSEAGLRAEIDRTIAAGHALLRAHQALLQAELSAIGGELARIAALAGCLLALGVVLGLLLTVGGVLFLGEWLFGSLGWGVALGVLACLAVGTAAALGVVGASRRVSAGGLVAGVAAAVVVALLLGANVPRQLAQGLAGRLITDGLRLDPAWAPVVMGLVVVAVVVGVAGVLAGWRFGGGAGAVAGAITGLVTGAVLGLLLGGLTYSRHGAVAVAMAVGLAAWPLASGVLLARSPFDPTARFRDLWPRESYDAAMATKVWLEQRWEARPGHRASKP